MDPETLKQYLADSPPSVVPLHIKPHFDALNDQEKLYAHYISMYVSHARYNYTKLIRQTVPASLEHA